MNRSIIILTSVDTGDERIRHTSVLRSSFTVMLWCLCTALVWTLAEAQSTRHGRAWWRVRRREIDDGRSLNGIEEDERRKERPKKGRDSSLIYEYFHFAYTFIQRFGSTLPIFIRGTELSNVQVHVNCELWSSKTVNVQSAEAKWNTYSIPRILRLLLLLVDHSGSYYLSLV